MRRFREVAEVIRDRVDRDEYPVGRRIPGKNRLAEEFGCSLDVVGQALALLAAEGVLDVVPRSGSFPLPRDQRRQGRWAVDLTSIRRHPRGYLLSAGTGDWEPIGAPRVLVVPCPADVAELLVTDVHPVDEGGEVVARRRVVGPGYPVQLTTTYLAPKLVEVVPVVGERDTGPGGWLERVEEYFGAPFTGQWWASSRPPTPDEAETFGLPPQVWVLVAVRLISATARPAAVEVVVWDARRVELVGEMTRREGAAWPPPPATMTNSPGT